MVSNTNGSLLRGGGVDHTAARPRKVVTAFPHLLPPGLATTHSQSEFRHPEARLGLPNPGKGLLLGEASGKV